MTVNQTKLSGGGEVGENVKKRSKLGLLRDRFRQLSALRQLIIIFSVSLAVLLLLGLLNYIYSQLIVRQTAQTKISTVCSSDQQLLNRATAAEKDFKVQEFSDLFNTIKLKKGHENDPSCTYILLQGYLANGQADEAQAQYDNLKTLIVEGGVVSPKLLDGATLNSRLIEDRIAYYKKTQQMSRDQQTQINLQVNKFQMELEQQ